MKDFWIVWNKSLMTYMKHPRGEWTRDITKAYCWHYKKEAGDEGRKEAYRVNRLSEVCAMLDIATVKKTIEEKS